MGCGSKRADPVDVVVCVGSVGGYIEREYDGGFRRRKFGIQDNRRILSRKFDGGDNETIKVAELKRVE